MERECHEMYGIAFRGNADLRPILLYEGFVGHPLRKDYPIDAGAAARAVPDVTEATLGRPRFAQSAVRPRSNRASATTR